MYKNEMGKKICLNDTYYRKNYSQVVFANTDFEAPKPNVIPKTAFIILFHTIFLFFILMYV